MEKLTSLPGVRPETVVRLNRFVPRPYQLKLCNALENKGYKKLLIIWPRRSQAKMFVPSTCF